MRAFAHKVALAVAPVFGVSIAIAVLRAADVPFPPALVFEAWAQWVVFAAVMYCSTALCFHVAGRLSASERPAVDGGSSHPA